MFSKAIFITMAKTITTLSLRSDQCHYTIILFTFWFKGKFYRKDNFVIIIHVHNSTQFRIIYKMYLCILLHIISLLIRSKCYFPAIWQTMSAFPSLDRRQPWPSFIKFTKIRKISYHSWTFNENIENRKRKMNARNSIIQHLMSIHSETKVKEIFIIQVISITMK